ncbi:TRAP transporter fused permease subunit [Pseudooceanicola sp. GBMRC 2024]|uniref:TRAP transporter fused permease subunit n=1 Tax=Pseudooceanicola albus TaxID=2692189 RepID=A0A6L7G043_9RHOB|nr:TRAP transporter fused permease subunit [Pseudooceanicola albus]MXN17724.1 TRAP transporter fused permease subunit [Pseudooceanicola albus]
MTSVTQFGHRAWTVVACAAVVLHLALVLFIPTADATINAWHLSTVLALGFGQLALDARRPALRSLLVLAALGGALTGIYFLLNVDAVFARFGLTMTDQVVAAIAVGTVVLLAYYLSGWVIPLIAIICGAYVLGLGRLFDGMFFFGGLTPYRMSYRMFWQDGALLGSTTTISATVIFMFVLLSTLMHAAGATQFIISAAIRLMRRIPGGSAHVAVLSSAIMGTVSGSAVANVAGTGTLTIPMMKRAGLSKETAGAVEAATSTGSQLIPPVMGAGIFIMADWTGIPYTSLVMAAIIPAILYFLSISFTIHLQLKRDGLLERAPEAEEPRQPINLIEGLSFVGPILLLIGLLSVGYSPVYAAGWSCAAVILCSWFGPMRIGPKRLPAICAETIRTPLPTAAVLICAGIIVTCVETSGLVVAMAQSLNMLGQANVLLIIALLAVISLFLGMGLPVTASYIIVASFGAQALITLDVSPVAAHMAMFWLSQDSLLTPPVCLAAYAAASISGGNPSLTGLKAMVFGKGLYVMPLLFIFHGLLFDQGPEAAVMGTLTGILALAAIAIASTGQALHRLGLIARLLTGASAGLILWPTLWVQAIGLALLASQVLAGRIAPRKTPSSLAMKSPRQ